MNPHRAVWPALLALLLAVAVVAGGGVAREASAQGTPAYLDPSLSPEERADDLLPRMSLAEKVGQMTQINATVLQGDPNNPWDRAELNPAIMEDVFGPDNLTGSILSGGGATPLENSPRAWAEMTNEIQEFAMARQPHGIPIIYGIDAVHGHNNVLGATMFPHQFGLGAAYDTGLARELANATATDVRATGIHWDFAPVADIWRDLRWGRSYEPFSEAPLAAGDLVAASVRGLEGNDLTTHVASTTKHFTGYSAPDSGRDRENATLTERELWDEHLPSFIRGIRAGTQTIMANSGPVNGEPVHASHDLLTTLLRDRLGFEGVVISDWEDIWKLVNVHHVAANDDEAIAMAINAGIDMSMVPLEADRFTDGLTRVVNSGAVPMSRINEAVRRILILKFRLGLFEQPLADLDEAEDIEGAHMGLARRAAASTMTLLENDGTLPLRRERANVLVTGPSADSMPNQLGGWSIGWQGATNPDEIPEGVTVREGIEDAVGLNARVRYAPGVPSGEDAEDPEARTEAREAAVRRSRGADVIVAVVGEAPYAETPGDTTTAALPAGQAELLDALAATGKPVVVVVIAGRPLMMGPQLDAAAAALMAYLPGTQGGRAVADVLFGRVNPSGRLSVTWPRSIAQAPLTHDRMPGEPYNPRYEFGHGLSYTRFDHSGFEAGTRGDDVRASIRVTNSGRRAGKHTVLVFASKRGASGNFPASRLVAYRSVWLQPGDRRTLNLSFPVRRLIVRDDGRSVVEEGRYRLTAEGETTTITIR
ncbi:MAG TPA: glycoside hydrolase family 3 N-terminal domain-containing protein [Thermoleophilaceae bacterium]|nr:glycoside hydrolase family 3 N-terminal domain-containing protein [Thermoleophilaceae bacterium]